MYEETEYCVYVWLKLKTKKKKDGSEIQVTTEDISIGVRTGRVNGLKKKSLIEWIN